MGTAGPSTGREFRSANLRLLVFTTLYPNAKRPTHGIFVETRLMRLVASRQVAARVVAPVPYVPNFSILPEGYRTFRAVPVHEERHGLLVDHPRYFLLPKVGMLWAPLALYLGARRRIAALVAEGQDFDVIDAHYFYPDGVAAVLLGWRFRKPVIITTRGSDLNVIARYRLPRCVIRWAAERAAAVIAVSAALRDTLLALGARPRRLRVLRNGVDLALFRPVDRGAARAHLCVEGTTLLSVGNLVPLKGHDLAIRALERLPGTRLLIVGDGPEEGRLRALAQVQGIGDRVRFLPRMAQDALPEVYAAADALLLLSTSEGWPNVLLEAMACGTPVVATAVGGTPEVVADPVAGELIRERTPEAVAAAVTRLLGRGPDRAAVRAYAEGFSWEATTQGQLDLMEEVLSDPLADSSLTTGEDGRPDTP